MGGKEVCYELNLLELNLHHIYIYDESIDLIQMLEIYLDPLSMVQSQTMKN